VVLQTAPGLGWAGEGQVERVLAHRWALLALLARAWLGAGAGAVVTHLTFAFPGEKPTARVSDSQNPAGGRGGLTFIPLPKCPHLLK